MRKIFINYRRAEAEYAAGALGRELRRHFGDDRIFRDKEDIGGGASWKRRVLDEINGESALLILIGRDWATVTDAQGRRRLDNPDDPLRMEIADGLKDGAAILPILLENAEMPADTELPDDLRSITEHNALRLRDGDWQYDLTNICRTLERAGFQPIASSPQTKDAPSVPKAANGSRVVLAAAIIALVSALAAFGVLSGIVSPGSTPGTSTVVRPAVIPPNDVPANVGPAAVSRVAPEPRREHLQPENRTPPPVVRPIVDRPTNQPDGVPAVVATGSSPVATTASDPEGGSLRDIVLGAWRYEVDQAVDGGRFRGAFTDQFLRNGASTSVGPDP